VYLIDKENKMELQKVSKAIAGALVTALVSYLTAKGIV